MTGELAIRVARLRESAEYKALVGEVEASLEEFKAGLLNAREDSEITRLTRYWQVTDRVLRTLRDTPEVYRSVMADRLGDEDSI